MVNFVETRREIYSTPLRLPKGEGRTILLRLKKREKKIFFFLETFFSQRKTPKQLCLRTLNLAWIRNVSFALFEEICF